MQREFLEATQKAVEEAVTPTQMLDEPQTVEERTTYLDTWTNNMFFEHKIPSAIFYYGFHMSEVQTLLANGGTLIPPISAVMSVSINPYLSLKEPYTYRSTTKFDARRFPIDSVADGGSLSIKVPDLKRITQQKSFEREICKVDPYAHVVGKTVGGARNWQNEGKLWNFPYCYGELNDGMMPPLDFKFHLARKSASNGIASIQAKTPITPSGTYQIYIKNYMNDSNGIATGAQNTRAPQLPTVSNSYTEYMAQSKAQNQAAKDQAFTMGALGYGVAAAGIIAAPFTGGTSLALTAGAAIVGGASSALSAMGTINQINAQERDMADVPARLLSAGNDGQFDLLAKSNSLYYSVKMVEETKLRVLGDFFAMYGYAQHKLMKPNVRNRHYYNYVKTVSVNMKTGGVPKESANLLKKIFDNGVTIWHVDRSGVICGDYSKDNYEV